MRQLIALLCLAAILTIPMLAYASTNQTQMTWVNLLVSAHSITYGGSCDDINFTFKETDANFDPDIDGNAAKVKPSPGIGINPPASSVGNERYTSFTIPCASSGNNCAFDINLSSALPTSAATHDLEFTNAKYTNLDLVDVADANTIAGTLNFVPNQKFVFKLQGAIHPQRIVDLNFTYLGSSVSTQNNLNCVGGGEDANMDFYIYNYNTTQYERLLQRAGSVSSYTGNNPTRSNIFMPRTSYILSNYVGSPPDNNITFLVRGVPNTSNGRYSCIVTEQTFLQYRAYDESSYCQSSTVAPMRIRNVGNTGLNIDGNFSSAFSGVDTNIVLKVWRGTPFCGNTGFGGWEKDCSITNTVLQPGTTTCKQFNSSNATTISRLITAIAVDGNASLCFSGDFNGFVGAGNHIKTFQTQS